MASPLLSRHPLAPLLATIRYPFTLLHPNISTLLSAPQITTWALYPVAISGLALYIYSFHLCANTAAPNPFVKCAEDVGEKECERWRWLGLVMVVGVVTVTVLVLYFGGKRVWEDGGREENEGRKKKTREDDKTDVSRR
ncbi:MAG: hypothetical protein Q9180_009001 [Flavoplaca navasiana]